MDTKELTRRLISLARPSDDINGDNPDMEALFASLGWEITKIHTVNPRNTNRIPHYLLKIGSKGKHVGFVTHWDVVGYGDLWDTPPNVGAVVDGKLFGRGSADMLSGLAISLIAGAKFKDQYRFSLFVAGDEEVEGNGVPLLMQLPNDPLDCIVGSEPTAHVIAGDAIKIGRRGRVGGRIKLFGDACHAAYVDSRPGTNLSDMLMRGKLTSLMQPYDEPVGMMPATSVAINRIQTAYIGVNTTPAILEIGFDARIGAKQTPDTFLAELRSRLERLGVRYELATEGITDPYFTQDEAFLRGICESIAKVTGATPEMNCAGGTSDCRFFGHLPIPIVEIGVENSSIHKQNECVSLESLEMLEKIYERILEDLA